MLSFIYCIYNNISLLHALLLYFMYFTILVFRFCPGMSFTTCFDLFIINLRRIVEWSFRKHNWVLFSLWVCCRYIWLLCIHTTTQVQIKHLSNQLHGCSIRKVVRIWTSIYVQKERHSSAFPTRLRTDLNLKGLSYVSMGSNNQRACSNKLNTRIQTNNNVIPPRKQSIRVHHTLLYRGKLFTNLYYLFSFFLIVILKNSYDFFIYSVILIMKLVHYSSLAIFHVETWNLNLSRWGIS